jgi:hypothetical protein
LAIVHARFGLDQVYQAVRTQENLTESRNRDFVFWETSTRFFWISLGMISSAIGGVAIGWSLSKPAEDERARRGRIRNVLLEQRVP